MATSSVIPLLLLKRKIVEEIAEHALDCLEQMDDLPMSIVNPDIAGDRRRAQRFIRETT